ncbi:hypothetical protein V1264_016975 [Littorina saxatilis]|uniref:Uncharacterized protein n=1 Tax=Littorina saxatilis TaxID=31220 RepID=A0AAN9GEV2_9CAEN
MKVDYSSFLDSEEKESVQQISYRIRFITAKNGSTLTQERGFVLTWFYVPPFPKQINTYHHIVSVGHSLGHHATFYRNQQVLQAAKDVSIFVVPQKSGSIAVVLSLNTTREGQCMSASELRVFELAGEGGTSINTEQSRVTCRSTTMDIELRFRVKQFTVVGISIHVDQNITYTGTESSFHPSGTQGSGDCITDHGLNPSHPPREPVSNMTYEITSLQQKGLQNCTTVFDYTQDPHELLATQVSVDTEDSPSCLHNYVQIGGTRFCGKMSKSFAEPYDRRLLEVSGGVFKNIALLRKTATQSSLYKNNTADFGPHLAVDGWLWVDPHNQTCAVMAGSDQTPWWKLDLLEDFHVWALVLTFIHENKTDFSGVIQPRDIVVEVYKSEDGSHKEFSKSIADVGTAPYNLAAYTYKFDVIPPATGRYVKVSKNSPGLGLCEVQVLINLAENNIKSVFWTKSAQVTRHNVALRKPVTYHSFHATKPNHTLYQRPELTNNINNDCKPQKAPFHGEQSVNFFIVTLSDPSEGEVTPGAHYRVYGVMISQGKLFFCSLFAFEPVPGGRSG